MSAFSRRSARLLSATLLAGLPCAALAQEVIQLDTVLVEVEGEGGAPEGGAAGTGIAGTAPIEGYVASDTTVASKTATPIIEVPQVVSVVGRQELDDRGVQQVDEALRYSPGVFTQPFGSDGDTDWSFIRGFQTTQTGTFMDGLPLFQYAFGSFLIDPFILERIDVLNGPSSVLYGGASAGGVINLTTKRANGERIRTVETGVTDDPNGYVGFDVGDRVDPTSPWSYRVTGRLKGGETEVDYADDFRGVVMPSLRYEPDAATRVDLYAIYQRDDQKHTSGFLPYVGTVVDAPYGRIPRDLFTGEPDADDLTSDQFFVGADIEHDLNETVTLRSNTRYGSLSRDEFYVYPFDSVQTDDELFRGAFGHQTDVDLFTTDNQAVFRFEAGPASHEVLTGIDYRHYRINQVQASNFSSTPSLDILDPVYGRPVPALAAPYIDEVVSLNEIGLYAQDQIKFDSGFILTLNGRYDSVWTDRDDRIAGNDYDTHDDAFSGRAALAYEFDNGVVPYISVSRFFEPQIGTNTAGEPVGPQEGEQYEAGVKYAPAWFDGIFTAAVFDLTRENTLQSRFVGGAFINEALGEVNSRGLELNVSANLTDDLELTASFTTYDIEITDDANEAFIGNQPFVVPETLASAFLNYTVPSGQLQGLQFGGGVRYIGESFADNLNEFVVPDVALVDARLAYEKDNWGVSLNVNNLFDEEYVASCQDTTACYYGEGRSALLKAHVNF